jgi:large conductance mechanosensitive channel
MIKEFKEFAFKGNLVDMAVGFILGGGFATVVKSLVDNVIMPPLGKLLAGIDFSKMALVLQDVEMDGDKVVKPEVTIKYGQFIQDFISFTILAFVVFIVVKKMLAAMKKEEAKPAAPAVSPEEKLLTEIRDLLKSRD